MQIAICDDLKAERNTLREYIDRYSCAEVLYYVIEEFESAESLLTEIKRSRVSPDILFMDIYLDGMTGMEAVKRLNARVDDDHILMKDGAKAPLTIKDRPSFKKAVSDYFFLMMRGNN